MCDKPDQITLTFDVIKNAPSYIVVEDDDGNERSFDKKATNQTLEFHDDGTVTVTLPRKLWERRMKRPPEKAPVQEARQAFTITRKCLVCRHPFKAEPQMRICNPCKNTAEWHSGDGYGAAI